MQSGYHNIEKKRKLQDHLDLCQIRARYESDSEVKPSLLCFINIQLNLSIQRGVGVRSFVPGTNFVGFCQPACIVERIFVESGDFVAEGNHCAFKVAGGWSGLGKHMLEDDVCLKFADDKMLPCVFQGNLRVLLAMQGPTGIGGFSFTPIVEEEIVEKASPGGGFIIKSAYL